MACIYSQLGDKERAFAWPIRSITTDRIDCPPPGWIPGSTRSEQILAFRISSDALAYRISLSR